VPAPRLACCCGSGHRVLLLLLLPGKLLLLLLLVLCYSLILKSTPSISFTCRQHVTAQHSTAQAKVHEPDDHTLWSQACLRDIYQSNQCSPP